MKFTILNRTFEFKAIENSGDRGDCTSAFDLFINGEDQCDTITEDEWAYLFANRIVELESQLKKDAETYAALDTQLENAHIRINSMEKDRNDLKKSIAEKHDEYWNKTEQLNLAIHAIEKLHNIAASRFGQIEKLHNIAASRFGQIEKLQGMIDARDKDIIRVNNDCSHALKELQQALLKIDELEACLAKADTLNGELIRERTDLACAKKKLIEEFHHEINKKDKKIDSQRVKINYLADEINYQETRISDLNNRIDELDSMLSCVGNPE